MTTPPLVHAIALHCDDESGHPMAFMASFGYDPCDPYAVRVVFHVAAGDVPWVLARSLLHRGLTRASGDGDVRIDPVLVAGRGFVQLRFSSPEGRLTVRADAGELLDFLLDTWVLVPPGRESEQVDLDVLVESLLGRV